VFKKSKLHYTLHVTLPTVSIRLVEIDECALLYRFILPLASLLSTRYKIQN